MICDRVIIIHQGKIVAEDRIENLSTLLTGGRSIRLEVQGPAAEVARRLERVKGVRQVRYEAPHHIVECPPDVDLRADITQAIVKGGWTILGMETVEMSLEDIFLQVTTEEEGDDGEDAEWGDEEQ